jgi:ferredoxin
LLADVRTAVRDASRPLELHTEAFQTSGSRAREYADHEFVVELSRTGTSLTVPAGQSVLRTVRDAGVTAPSSCEDGWCGTCETRVLDGEVEHRDSVLSDDEIDRGDTMMICVSRARSGALVLDL